MFDTLVFIGRLQPMHIGHEMIIDEALKQCERLIILVGSANRARSIQNPFTYSERYLMIRNRWHWAITSGKLVVVPLNDYLYNDDAWTINVQKLVKINALKKGKVGLVGFSKDASSYYLKLFPQWGALDIPSQYSTFNSTDIRRTYLQAMPIIPHDVCSIETVAWLKGFMYTIEFQNLVVEAHAIEDYKKQWSGPFPPTFNTVDPVVVQSGHILLIRRKEFPGKGLLAFPGGFLNRDETLLEGVIRELKEETNIADGRGEIPPGVLKSFITKSQTFDDPRRSSRGRTITQAFLFELPKKPKLYKVVGDDDAEEANWYPIGSVPANEFMEDHYFIMCKMLGLTME